MSTESATFPSDSIPPAGRLGVVLLSGGLDSATTLAVAMRECDECVALSFDYGQRHHFELQAAQAIVHTTGVTRHVTVAIDLRSIGGSALTSNTVRVPQHDNPHLKSRADIAGGSIPVTYVPARNAIFLSIAVAHAEAIGSRDVYIGATAVDFSGYPDCRPEFIEAFEHAMGIGTKAGAEKHPIRIHAPLINLSKAEIIRRGQELGVNYALTHSCYDPDPVGGAACGRCDACILRKRGFEEAGIPDPTRYR